MTQTEEVSIGMAVADVARMTSEQLDVMFDALKSRRRVLQELQGAEALGAIAVGDYVRLKGLSPKYVNGTCGTVISKADGKFKIEFDLGVTSMQVRNRFGMSVTCPASCVEKVDA